MSLFQFGFTCVSNSSPGCSQEQSLSVPAHMPTLEESGLGTVEYESTLTRVPDLADPTPTKKRRQRGTYTHYKAKDRAKIGKYALENGNTSTRCHFSAEFPDLKESTIRNFKKVYKEHLGYQRKQLHPKAVTEIPSQPRGHPPLLLEIDTKLLSFLKAVRRRGGVVNSHVVHAAAKALIRLAVKQQQLSKIDLPRSWVQSIYRRMGLIRRMATTSRPPVPQGLYDECRNHYLREVDERLRNMLYHQSLC